MHVYDFITFTVKNVVIYGNMMQIQTRVTSSSIAFTSVSFLNVHS